MRLVLFLATTLSLSVVHAEVTSLEVSQRAALANGKEFGAAGAYEEISGTVYFAVNPAKPQNQVIADVSLAPRNAKGQVEFSADVVIWKPVDLARGNGVTVVDIANRGSRVITAFNRPLAGSDFGDAFLMQQGYTIVWVGWEYDVPATAELGLTVPSVPDVANSALSGLGMAAVRDMASWIKHAPDALFTSEHLLAFGLSQSGRFLRTFLYYGMNTDEAGRQVFDGILPHIAGASRLDVNRRGAEPTGLGAFMATAYPFTDAALPDAVSGSSEGLLENPRAQMNQPRIIYTDSAVEYWGGGRVAALTHTLPDGSADIELPGNVRRFFLAGTQHGPGMFPPEAATTGQLPGNPLDYWWFMRAQLTNLKEWVVNEVEPPASRYPRFSDRTLVALAQLEFPLLAGVHSPMALTAGTRAGQDLAPVVTAAALPLLVPQVDVDGNELGGLRHPELSVPLATYTGWNFTQPERGDPDSLVALAGAYIPFAINAEARAADADPRLSITERYRSKVDFLNQVDEAARELVSDRLLLPQDLNPIVQRASAHWDLLMTR